MDISFNNGNEKFNYRVCAMIINEGKILAMKDDNSPYYYLPGGRVKIGETAEHAVLRECKEELNAEPEIIRPLWLNQAFFTEDVSRIRFHELCLYFLMDISKTDIISRGDKFVLSENGIKHIFEWLLFENLENEYF
jgi:ADP-ribose pyrophosphatase YjhB (NUDIX family)